MATEAEVGDAEQSGAPGRVGLHGGLSRSWKLGTAFFVLAFLAVNVLYGISTLRPEVPFIRNSDKVSVYINPYAVNPAEDTIKAKVTVAPPDELFADTGLTSQIDIHFTSEEKTVTFPVGSKTLSADLVMIAEFGSYEWYPLDRYSEPMLIFATMPAANGAEQSLET